MEPSGVVNLVDEVLDLVSVESGKVALTIEPVEPGTIIESCLILTETQANSRDIELINRASSKALAPVSDGAGFLIAQSARSNAAHGLS